MVYRVTYAHHQDLCLTYQCLFFLYKLSDTHIIGSIFTQAEGIYTEFTLIQVEGRNNKHKSNTIHIIHLNQTQRMVTSEW